jgi:hypothetical protein
LVYNIDLESEFEPDVVNKAENYFDGIDINARCAACGEQRHIGSWELA